MKTTLGLRHFIVVDAAGMVIITNSDEEKLMLDTESRFIKIQACLDTIVKKAKTQDNINQTTTKLIDLMHDEIRKLRKRVTTLEETKSC